MRVLIITICYTPEIGAIARITTEISEVLKEQGHQVTVVTGFPNHPFGVIPKEYRGKLFHWEKYSGVKLIRTYIYASPKKNRLTRILNYGSFSISSILGALFSGKHDVIFTIFPPPLVGIPTYITGLAKRIPFVLSVQDIWPELPVSLGEIKNKYLIKFLEIVEALSYKWSESILVISNGFKRRLEEKGVLKDKIHVVPNWVDVDFITPGPRYNGIRAKYGLGDKFIVMFAGTIGLCQGLECVIDAASLISDNKDILFLFVGEGAEKQKLQDKSQEYKLENVIFLPAQPREYMPDFLAAADVCLVTLQNKPLFKITIPCKTYEIMAAGRPIVANVDGDLKELVEQAGCGIVVEPENPKQMSDAIIRLYEDQQLRTKLGRSGREYVVQHYTRARIMDEFIKVFQEAITKRKE